MDIKLNFKERLANYLIHIIFVIFSLSVLIPFILTFIVSISDEKSIILKGYSFFPTKWSLAAYKVIFSNNEVFQAYGVSIAVTVIGTFLSLLLCALAAYAMSVKKVKYRNKISLYFYIPMVFNAGLVPWYLVISNVLHMKNSIWALIFPMLISPFNIFLIRNYFNTIPGSLLESAEIDGARPFTTFFKIIVPLSTPIIATVSLFIALAYWNDWVLSLWFIDKKELYSLQYLLYRIQYKQFSSGLPSSANTGVLPMQTVQIATLFVTIGPIILLYPFIQRYFVKGIMVGAVKG